MSNTPADDRSLLDEQDLALDPDGFLDLPEGIEIPEAEEDEPALPFDVPPSEAAPEIPQAPVVASRLASVTARARPMPSLETTRSRPANFAA